ncbi:MAG: MATE family efflux transporter [Lachnospiraceae bacterium]|nr:MATE family efflux transporter [Lachnospiraceae bacterium]
MNIGKRKAAARGTGANRGIIEGTIWKQLLLFFFPILFGAFFQQLYNTVDAVIVGRFVGTNELAAVGGSTGTLINLLFGFFIGLSSGATVIIAQFYGAGDETNVSRAVHTAVALAIVGGAVLTVIGQLLGKIALRWMQTPDEVIGFAEIYLRIFFLGMIPNLYYNICAAILRAVGDSRRPLYILIFTCLMNVVLDLLFVVVFRLSVTGVAVATVLSQLISAVLITVCLMRTKDCYRLDWKQVRFHKTLLIRIIQIGLPAGFQSVMYNLANIVIQSNVNLLGSSTMAAYTAYSKIDSVFWMLMNAFGVSVSTFSGQNFGAGRIDRVKKSMKICLAMAMGTTIGLSVLLHFVGEYVYMLFSGDEEVIRIGMQILHFLTPIYFTYVSIEVISGTVRAMGFVVVPMLMTCGGVCVLRLLWLFLVVPSNRTITMILFSYPLSWVVTTILFFLYYWYLNRSGKIRARGILNDGTI